MPRHKPEPSEELAYLRTVMSQEKENDDPADVTLKRYRKLMDDDDRWVLQQKMIAEKHYREEVADWKREGKKDKAEDASGPFELEPCEVLVRRLMENLELVK